MRSVITSLALALCVGSFLLVTDGIAVAAKPRSKLAAPATRILLIGDSLSAGPFGEAVQQHLARRFGPQNVAAWASCGSSPENWLASEPEFYTKCGYRESTPDKPPVYRDFVDGKPPRPTLTPKIESLVRRHQPTVVIVQLGTNWMDRNLTDAVISGFTHRFVTAARSAGARQVIWIAPPDSSAFRKVQGRVHRLLQESATRNRFEVIDSRRLTHYVPGQTGGDGIHYNTASSRDWAAKINTNLNTRLRSRVLSR
ncbi:hypothetical protein BH18VER1_BH18VER1_22310 [soil metagenome]